MSPNNGLLDAAPQRFPAPFAPEGGQFLRSPVDLVAPPQPGHPSRHRRRRLLAPRSEVLRRCVVVHVKEGRRRGAPLPAWPCTP
eukprot:3301594-Alexandrium_andersonii.AAC.1